MLPSLPTGRLRVGRLAIWNYSTMLRLRRTQPCLSQARGRRQQQAEQQQRSHERSHSGDSIPGVMASKVHGACIDKQTASHGPRKN